MGKTRAGSREGHHGGNSPRLSSKKSAGRGVNAISCRQMSRLARNGLISLPAMPPELILAIDIGTSSTRSALFDVRARRLASTTAQQGYPLITSTDGGAEL